MDTETISLLGTGAVGLFAAITQYLNYKRSAKKHEVTELKTTCNEQQKEIDLQSTTLIKLKDRIDECESDRQSLRREVVNVRAELLEALLDLNKNKEAKELNVKLAEHINELKAAQFELEKKLFNAERELSDLKTLYAKKKK